MAYDRKEESCPSNSNGYHFIISSQLNEYEFLKLTWHCVAEPRGGLRVHLHVLHVEHLTRAAAVQERHQQSLVL